VKLKPWIKETSMQKTALVTAGIIFTLLAISHFIRWLYAVEVLVDGKTLPVVASIFACVFLALLAIWMFIAAKKMKPTLNPIK
jgi:O-antigen/teichoic acid export membrane protein